MISKTSSLILDIFYYVLNIDNLTFKILNLEIKLKFWILLMGCGSSEDK